ncbi:hypothetical protein [Opitutus sp. ER46]|uniref:hypothetical protein n=1 Tax=Opitutus sp. ER46 TaxID=2161864 RepID=UPI001304DD39|nr:hypothetical protein [Opitutus sp. ER46]
MIPAHVRRPLTSPEQRRIALVLGVLLLLAVTLFAVDFTRHASGPPRHSSPAAAPR